MSDAARTLTDDGAVRAQAAAWLARLRSEERGRDDEAGFRAWLAESERHRHAFDAVNTAWEVAGGLAADSALFVAPARREQRSRRAVLAGAAGLVAAVAGAGVWREAFAGTYATGVGEQRRVALADGSLVILDTDTRVRVRLGDHTRAVSLIQGRAHFDVAKDAARPFVVSAGGEQVTALGTAFDVERHADAVSVVLMHGRVAIRREDAAPSAPPTTVLQPGDRVVVSTAAPPRHDRPDLARLTAWQSGRAVFDNEPVAQAVAEMNRYSRRPIVIADPAVGALRVSGVYSTGDTEAFARSLSTLLPVEVSVESERVTLSASAAKDSA